MRALQNALIKGFPLYPLPVLRTFRTNLKSIHAEEKKYENLSRFPWLIIEFGTFAEARARKVMRNTEIMRIHLRYKIQ